METEIDLGIDYKAIGKRLRAARVNSQFKQEEVANILDTNPSYISSIENGLTKLGLPMLIRLSRLYKTSVDHILYDNLPVYIEEYDAEAKTILSDCNEKERRFLLLLMKEAKEISRRELNNK